MAPWYASCTGWSHREGLLHIEVPIGAALVQAKATAGLKHGALRIRVRKTEESRSRIPRVPATGWV
jgi:HSP20 family molecular chaperone IbpA